MSKNKLTFNDLKDLVDDTVTDVVIETPLDFKCEICDTDFKHVHVSFPSLNKK